MTTTFTTKINKIKVEFELTIDKYSWQISCNNDEIDFSGIVADGHYNYNNTDIIYWPQRKEFKFFEEDLKNEIRKIAKKNKFFAKR